MRFQSILKYMLHLMLLDQKGQEVYFDLNLFASYWICVNCQDKQGFPSVTEELVDPSVNPFLPNAPSPYLLKTSENLTVFCFQGLEKQ